MVYYNNVKVSALVLIKQIIPPMLYFFNIGGIYYLVDKNISVENKTSFLVKNEVCLLWLFKG